MFHFLKQKCILYSGLLIYCVNLYDELLLNIKNSDVFTFNYIGNNTIHWFLKPLFVILLNLTHLLQYNSNVKGFSATFYQPNPFELKYLGYWGLIFQCSWFSDVGLWLNTNFYFFSEKYLIF